MNETFDVTVVLNNFYLETKVHGIKNDPHFDPDSGKMRKIIKGKQTTKGEYVQKMAKVT